jgi:hypothetical protein
MRLCSALNWLVHLLTLMCYDQAIGSLELSAKFKECRTAIKRDIVFAASLYL